MTIELRFQPYRLFPYERSLALREVEKLGLAVLDADATRVVAEGSTSRERLRRLTYFSEVVLDDIRIEPDAAGLERSHMQRRNGHNRPRQATRYSVHGLHEYKGKFHPQLVRAFANLLDVSDGDLVVDPFCGSGTTLVEALLMGCDTVGIDLSPMATLVTRAKIAALRSGSPSSLSARLREWGDRAATDIEHGQTSLETRDLPDMSPKATQYLQRWFSPPAFAAMTQALEHVNAVRADTTLHLVASVCLSSTLRTISLQAPEDLRVRRRPEGFEPPSLANLVLASCRETAAAILETAEVSLGLLRAEMHRADAAEPGLLARTRGAAKRMAVITSPPYATALPYIDTDRLSLVALGLVQPDDVRSLEAELVGSREWPKTESREWERRLAGNADALPYSITALCRRIEQLNGDTAGFRRRAVPALLYRYFTAMSGAFGQLRGAMKPGEHAVFIVGLNRTGRGEEQVVIDTPRLLGDVASGHGLETKEVVVLETWPRYGLHHENGVQGESAVVLVAR